MLHVYNFLRLFEGKLEEMRIHNLGYKKSCRFIAYREDLWLIPFDKLDEPPSDKAQAIFGERFGGTWDEIVSALEDSPIPGVLTGHFNEDKTIYINDTLATSAHPVTSLLFKKVFKALRANYVEYTVATGEDEDSSVYDAFEIKGSFPRTGYHGTSVKAAASILRLGIRPDVGSSKWAGITDTFSGLVFFSVDPKLSQFHALGGRYGPKDGIVFEFTIPDTSLIVPDYDVARSFTMTDEAHTLGYTNADKFTDHFAPEPITPSDRKHWKGAGVFGYRGAIPPKFLTRAWVSMDRELSGDSSSFKDINIKDLQQALYLYNDYGYYLPGMEDDIETE
jgi:hypothetical protein